MRSPETHIIERARIERQRDLDGAKTRAERNKLGQFATPPQLALDILRQTKKYLDSRAKIRFLDPAFGTGSFFSALLSTCPRQTIKSASGFEIDPHYGDEAKVLWESSALNIQIKDFFDAPLPDQGGQANLIVCNPPYVRHHHLPTTQKAQLSGTILQTVGLRINGLSGLYCYFMIYSHNWLAENGIGCWLVPSEFMDVNYGAVVKEYLLHKVTLLRIHRFDENESQFDDALVSSAVVWFKNIQSPIYHSVDFTFGGTIEKPRLEKHIPSIILSNANKWTRFPATTIASPTDQGLRLSDFFTVKRGLATGDNKFFILSAEEVKKHNLPKKFLQPILPSPRYLKDDIVEADRHGNPIVENSRFLISCKLHPHLLKKDYPTLWKYLQSGLVNKINNAYICQHRKPWYAQEDRPASPFLCTYMGRRDSPNSTFRFILNFSQATAANVYLLLYPKLGVARYLEKHPHDRKLIWEGLRSISTESLIQEGRVYGGGLYKLEPRELAHASAEPLLSFLPALRTLTSRHSTQQSFL